MTDEQLQLVKAITTENPRADEYDALVAMLAAYDAAEKDHRAYDMSTLWLRMILSNLTWCVFVELLGPRALR
jgi:hypothetical protein